MVAGIAGAANPSMECTVWSLNRRSSNPAAPPPASGQNLLAVELDAVLTERLRRLAQLRAQPPHELALALLARGLDQAVRQAQAASALESLTPRQQQVAWLIARGYTNRQIAETLVVSPETVKTHVRNILAKFEAASKAELRVLLLDLGARWWQAEQTFTPPPRRQR